MGPVRLMLVDDSSAQRHIIRRRLGIGDEVEVVAEASGGREAVALYERVKPDVVLLDLVMPDMGGEEVLEAILAMDPSARVVIVSSMGTDAAIERCLDLGARSFLQKPFDQADLERTLRTLATRPEEVA
jgi:two-component system, chemotaxis family, chemotaxis protein CheY